MRKNGFTIVEVVVVFLLILGVTFLILPRSLDTTRQARFVSKWSEKYSEMEYMFSVVSAQQDSRLKEKFSQAQDNNDRKKILLETIKPYLRITSEENSKYQPKYMNGSLVTSSGRYYFNSYYKTSSSEIVGLKWITKNCIGGTVCGIISIDLNGIDPPNIWGRDIFGINVLNTGIEPLGKGLESDILRNDCSKFGFGLYCSYYYLMGGKFD